MYIGGLKVSLFEIICSIGVVWIVNVFSGGSGFDWKRVIWEFTFKGSISSVFTGGCFS